MRDFSCVSPANTIKYFPPCSLDRNSVKANHKGKWEMKSYQYPQEKEEIGLRAICATGYNQNDAALNITSYKTTPKGGKKEEEAMLECFLLDFLTFFFPEDLEDFPLHVLDQSYVTYLVLAG